MGRNELNPNAQRKIGVQLNPLGSIWGPKRSIFMLDSRSLAV